MPNGPTTEQPVHYSDLRYMARSPRAYRWHMDHPDSDSPAKALGRAIHARVLAPADDERFIVRPAHVDGRTKVGKIWMAAQSGTVLTAEQGAVVDVCAGAILSHPAARALLDAPVARELSVEWTDKLTWLGCAGRIDLVTGDAVVDVKSTATRINPIREYYHAQLAWYRRGLIDSGYDIRRAYIIAVETVAPYDVCVIDLTNRLPEGERICDEWLALLVDCLAGDVWPGRWPTVISCEEV